MLSKLQMELVEHVFKSMKDMLFAAGNVPQSYTITKGGEAMVFPLPDSIDISTGINMELMEKWCEVEETELVIFISEIWNAKREDKIDAESEALMMLVLEVKSKKLHMKMGGIKRDSEGGAYVEDDEWLPEADLSNLKMTGSPSKLYS